ncbi:MAG: LysE family transporter, partial [Gammaproteobacteria bacterium]|nr:LysE family transporter [Gammaproteobacteria bacterium]
ILAKSYVFLFVLIKVAATAYLLFLAWRFWYAKPQVLVVNKTPSKRDLLSSFLAGWLVTMANPKTITFYLALVPMVIDLSRITFAHWAFGLVPISIVVLLGVGGFYILASISARRILSSTHSQKLIYRCAATAMAAAAGSMVLKGV